MPDRMLNFSTKIAVTQSATEVTAILGQAGADAVQVRYRDRQPVGVSFVLTGPHGDRTFSLPVDTAGVGRAVARQWRDGAFKRRDGKGHAITHAQAHDAAQHARIAWRVLKDWLEAQLALVSVEMAALDQVMLPYLHVDDTGDRTLYQAYREREQAALEAGGAA